MSTTPRLRRRADKKSLMPELLTRWERRGWRQGREEGREEGHEEGLAEGISATIIRLLRRKQIALDTAAEQRIRSLGRDTLLVLVDALFDFQARADLDYWPAQAAQE
jgi:predicted transposase YdaD